MSVIGSDKFCDLSETVSSELASIIVIPEQSADDNKKNKFHVKSEKFRG